MKLPYTCERCGEACGPEGDWTEEKAAAEFAEDFADPAYQLIDKAVICDTCHKEFKAWLDALPQWQRKEFDRQARREAAERKIH